MTDAKTSLQAPFKPLQHFNDLRRSLSPQVRLRHVRKAAQGFREQLMDGPPVAFYQSFDLVRVPYPIRYGLRDVATSLSGFIHILNRLFVVQFKSEHGTKTLLVSPSDVELNTETPFFKRLASQFGPLYRFVEPILAPRLGTVEGCLKSLGIKAEDVDYITYDHLHTQELRRWFGGQGYDKAIFPNAKLLVMRQEWESTKSLLAPQRDWYCPHGTDGIDEGSVILLDDDVLLGEGLALIRTPGHTEGNHSIVVRSPEGVVVTSENGIAADAYAPSKSRWKSFRRYARETGMELILNGNTLERGLDQYISMMLEREMAGPCPQNPDFYNVVPSSEWSSQRLLSSLKPTMTFGNRCFGQLREQS
jgi:hypothetical protein